MANGEFSDYSIKGAGTNAIIGYNTNTNNSFDMNEELKKKDVFSFAAQHPNALG